MVDYIDIRTDKARNPAGPKRVLYFCPLDDFTVIAEPPANPATLEEANVIDANHTHPTDKGFFKLELETDKNELTSEYIGEVMGGDQAFEFTGFATGMGDAQIALFEKLVQEKHIVLIPTKDNKYLQLGEPDNGVMFKAAFQLGKESDGERGFNVSVKHFGRMQRYDGTITFADSGS
jgi:hypothetical protein